MKQLQENNFSHLNTESGDVNMVNISHKNMTQRVAIARSIIQVSPDLIDKLHKKEMIKGNVLTVAKTAGILAAKNTSQMIPLCHTLYLDFIDIQFTFNRKRDQINIQSEAVTSGKTGVEMEALTAVTIAGLTIYDMCKAIDKKILILQTGLYKKTGGQSGEFINETLSWESDKI